MFDDDEAFPNSERLFKEALAKPDPVPCLSKLLKKHQTLPVVYELVIIYMEEVEENPSRGHHLASSMSNLVGMYDSPDKPSFGTETLADVVADELAGHHFKSVHGAEKIKGYSPNNAYLLNSFLSGLSLKYGLTSSPGMYTAIKRGLDARSGSDDDAQELVVGTCIQLLLHGSEIVTEKVGSYRTTAQQVASKLKAQKAMGTVKDPHAIELLEVHI
jgi:hypothetical protein